MLRVINNNKADEYYERMSSYKFFEGGKEVVA
jgi:hypothetical protein